jgi:murein L,D-transpeptidase YcbB/YkuD
MKTSLIALLSIFLFAFTCSSDKKENTNDLESEVTKSLDEAGFKAEDFKEKLDELLTLEIASQVSSLPSGEAKKKTSSLAVSYEWKSDRTRSIEIVKGNPMKVPVSNSIELSWVKNTTLEQFKHDYHNPTSEELKKADEAMGKKMEELEANGKATNEQTSAASGIAKNAMSNFSVEEVPNIGDYSVFVNTSMMGAKMRDLKVFYRGLSFTISADLSDNLSENDKKAIETAKLIINQKLQ